MTLDDVARKINKHESTVSRAVHEKYVQTPRGLLPLSYFFSSSLSTISGSHVSSKSIKARIREIIQQENKEIPLSDQKIAEVIKLGGVSISRRTVAKYREELRIPNSQKRVNEQHLPNIPF